MELRHIDLACLSVSPANMRDGRKAPDLANILPSVRARGILVPLIVRHKPCPEPVEGGSPETFEIVAGRRRYHAALTVAEETGEAEPLPCAVMSAGDDAAALEASLIENVARLDPDEVTRWESFTRLVREGRSPDQIAKTFGLTELQVKRTLALGNLLPRVRSLYKRGDIDVVTVRQLTLVRAIEPLAPATDKPIADIRQKRIRLSDPAGGSPLTQVFAFKRGNGSMQTLRHKRIVREVPLPPLSVVISFAGREDPETIVAEPLDQAPHLISGLVCIIDYAGETRLITGRRYDLIGDKAYVGAICHTAGGYRQFRCDRISAVMDAYSGEVLGDGNYFDRFDVDSRREKAPSWGLPPGQKRLLVSGLNVLAFMARCDGRWHPLETQPIERFVCSLWLRKEWPGEPPIDEILAHAQRLAPDSDVFFRSLTPFVSSRSSMSVLRRAVAELIEADGVVCSSEFDWARELEEACEQATEVATPEFVAMLQVQGVLD